MAKNENSKTEKLKSNESEHPQSTYMHLFAVVKQRKFLLFMIGSLVLQLGVGTPCFEVYEKIFLITAYPKNVKDNLTDSERNEIKQMIHALEEQLRENDK